MVLRRTAVFGALLFAWSHQAIAEDVPATACEGQNCAQEHGNPVVECDGQNCSQPAAPPNAQIECVGENCDPIPEQGGSGAVNDTSE